MLSDKLAEFIMRGLPQAVLVSVAFTVGAFLLPPLGLISGAAVAMVALRIGAPQGVLIALISSVALAVLVMVTGLPPAAGFMAGMLQWLPIVGMALVLRQTGSWATTLQVAIGFSMALILVAYMVNPDLVEFWRGILDRFLGPVLKETSGMPLEESQEIVTSLASRFTGLILTSFLLSSILALLIGRYLQALRFNPGGFGVEFRELRVGLWPALVAVVLIGLSYATNAPLPLELAMVAGSVYVFQGLAVIHSIVVARELHKGVLIGTYMMLILFMSVAFTVIAGLGLLDAFADIRAKLTTNAASKSE